MELKTTKSTSQDPSCSVVAVVQMSFAEYHSKQYQLEQVFILKNMGHLMFRS